ncbi:eukaryotic aspartyl protease family protein [Artemisia annua]|uniref:Eukaryotic aspartyl protease family protein n=1 Tax=Artemisia annua TaxID=35608 RepID=A0A2U1PJH5_ARTAN|nr:eukaryotic aspartyl protease family protein [Artemisia annua]
MLFLIQLLASILAFISHGHEARAQPANTYTSLVFPITKHTDTNPLYSIQITIKGVSEDYGNYMDPSKVSNYLIDIDAPIVWHDCIDYFQFGPLPISKCKDAQPYSYNSSSCPPLYLPNYEYYPCPVNVFNPVTRSCDDTYLNADLFEMKTSDGKSILSGVYRASVRGSCASRSSFQSFPKDVTGVMAFSSAPYALPASLGLYGEPLSTKFKKITALCLPSNSSTPGVLFVGNGPYYLPPNLDVDIRSLLSYTPLLKHPDSFGYFISVNAIVIKMRSIIIPVNATTKLSTIEPYTTLRTDIYTSLVRRFSKVTRRIPSAKPIAPFGLCFSTATNGTKVGLKVPNIDLRLHGGMTWTISSANSIKQMTNDVGCLAFVDGGSTSETAITIGTFQFENNLVVFDSENSTFGFSSSLLSQNTSCANFNFTITMDY